MSKTLARRIDVLEAGRGGVDAPSRFLISFGKGAEHDEVVTIFDSVAGRSHHRHIGERAALPCATPSGGKRDGNYRGASAPPRGSIGSRPRPPIGNSRR